MTDQIATDPEAKRDTQSVWRRKEFIDAIVGGYEATDSGEPVDLFRFAEFVLDQVESGGMLSDECRQLILWTMMQGDSSAYDVRQARERAAYHFVVVVEKI